MTTQARVTVLDLHRADPDVSNAQHLTARQILTRLPEARYRVRAYAALGRPPAVGRGVPRSGARPARAPPYASHPLARDVRSPPDLLFHPNPDRYDGRIETDAPPPETRAPNGRAPRAGGGSRAPGSGHARPAATPRATRHDLDCRAVPPSSAALARSWGGSRSSSRKESTSRSSDRHGAPRGRGAGARGGRGVLPASQAARPRPRGRAGQPRGGLLVRRRGTEPRTRALRASGARARAPQRAGPRSHAARAPGRRAGGQRPPVPPQRARGGARRWSCRRRQRAASPSCARPPSRRVSITASTGCWRRTTSDCSRPSAR